MTTQNEIKEWLGQLKESKKKKRRTTNWGSLRGALKEEKRSSVELQHATSRARMQER